MQFVVSDEGFARYRTAAEVRRRVGAGGERFWRLEDFQDLPAGAVVRTLSRLADDGTLKRIQKGLYWRARPTIVGLSVPGATAVLAETARAPLHPAGLTAASFLGLTTQNPMRGEFATPAPAAPRSASDLTVHTRRPPARTTLDMEGGALLELLRDRGRTSDLAPSETVRRVVHRLRDPAHYAQLATVAASEPPRVRAILGALGEEAGAPVGAVQSLRASLNPVSRFDFGAFAVLPNAQSWQAR